MQPTASPLSIPATPTGTRSAAEISRLAIDLYENSVQGAAVRSEELLRQSRRGSRCLVAVAIVQTIWLIAMVITARMIAEIIPLVWIQVISAACLAGLFWMLAIWSRQSPLAPAVAGLTLFLTMWWSTAAYSYAMAERHYGEKVAIRQNIPNSGTLVKFAITIALIRAITAGAKHRRLQKQLTTLDSSLDHSLPLSQVAATEPKRLAGLGTSIALYVTLLYLSINMIALWGSSDLTPDLFKRLVGVSAIIVVVWSIACWRDVYRPLIQPINPGWYVIAIAGGCLTFGVAHFWTTFVRDLAQLTPNFAKETAADPWHMQVLLTAVNPAIIEEIAFRGIIFGALLRSLRGWETVVVTALMFMVLHLNVPAFPHLLLGGILFGVLRLKSGSWLPGVFMHFVHNFLAIIVP